MKHSRTLAVLLLGVALWGLPATSRAADTTCTGSLGPVLVDKVIVPSGTDCVLEGTQVRGDVVVKAQAGLFADRANIGGNLTTEPTASVYLDSARVRGNVQLQRESAFGSLFAELGNNVVCKGCILSSINLTTIANDVRCDGCRFQDVIATSIGGNLVIKGESEGSFMTGNHVEGNVEIAESSAVGYAFELEHNVIDGNLKLAKNVGLIRIAANRVGGDLQVLENTSPDMLIAHNQVSGNVQLAKSVGPSEVVGNTIGKTLNCTDNQPRPVSVDNVAQRLDGQCAAPGAGG